MKKKNPTKTNNNILIGFLYLLQFGNDIRFDMYKLKTLKLNNAMNTQNGKEKINVIYCTKDDT